MANPQKLYSHFISIPQGERLISIIAQFKNLTGLENMCGAIDGTHIRLAEKPPISLIPADYWNRHDHHSVLLQGVCDANLLFWDVCVIKGTWRNSRCNSLSGFIFVQGFFGENYFARTKHSTRLSISSTLHCG